VADGRNPIHCDFSIFKTTSTIFYVEIALNLEKQIEKYFFKEEK